MQPTRALRLVVIIAVLVTGVGVWPPATASAAAPVLVAAQPPTGSDQERGDGGPDRSSAERSAAAARAQAAAAERRARAAAAAARRAAQLAAAGQRVRATWEARGRPARLVIVRDDSLDVVTQGRLTRSAPRRVGPLSVTTLSRYLPRSWLAIDGGTATLSAALVLTPRVVLDVGGDITTLKLVGGATPPEAAAIYTGSGRVVLHGLTVTSADASGQPLAATPGRPFLVATSGGRIEATDVTMSDLGTSDDGPEPRPALQFNPGSTGSVVRSTFTGNSVGLRLQGSQDVRIEDVTITESLGHGLAASRDTGTVLRGIRAERNAGDGVRLHGTATAQPITGVTTAGNGRFGVAAVRLRDVRLEDLHTTGDTAGGLELGQVAGVTVSGFTAVGEPIGLYVHITSTNVTLDRLAVTGGRRGVAIEKTTRNLVLQASTFDDVKVTGVAVGGAGVEVRNVAVTDSQTAVRVERGADGVTLAGLRLRGGVDGVVATAGTRGLVLDNLSAMAVGNDAVRSFSPDTRITGGRIVGATCGITAGAATTITQVSMSLVDNGIRARTREPVRAEAVDIDAVGVGVDVATESQVVIADSRVHAMEAVRGEFTQQGTNELSLPPLNLLGAIGIPLILLALILEMVHVARQRRAVGRRRRWTPPTVSAEAVQRSVTKTSEEPGKEHRSGRPRSAVAPR
jgi:nitrous oxidase accessory protein NosD